MPVHSVTAGALGMTEGRANPKVPGFLAEQIEAKGETVPQRPTRMEARIADLMEAKMKAGFPPDLEALQKAITQDLSREDELRKYLMALAVHRQTEEILDRPGLLARPGRPRPLVPASGVLTEGGAVYRCSNRNGAAWSGRVRTTARGRTGTEFRPSDAEALDHHRQDQHRLGHGQFLRSTQTRGPAPKGR